MPSGYSGTPLAKKLSLKDGMRVWWSGMPESVRAEISGAGLRLQLLEKPQAPLDEAHVFVTSREELEAVPGLGGKFARELHRELHKTGV